MLSVTCLIFDRSQTHPDFQKSDTYLQGSPPRSEGQAVLGNGDNAGQFLIVSGGLIQLTSRSPSYTYCNVNPGTGAITFVDGDVAPSSAGKYSFVSIDKTVNWTASDGTVYTVSSSSLLLCYSAIC
jgi:hypothetical protein